ncbi:multidrug efflux SMR transporter [Cytobacillus firmus]|nr:multidrug efflux SMR transporter [Cytobacillus firmus]WHY32188.1 multidrug efflux SMR transporter [Cytobacillus firmus]
MSRSNRKDVHSRRGTQSVSLFFIRIKWFYKNWPSTISCLVFGSLSFYFLSLSVTSLPMGTAYAIWTAIGSAGSVVAGMIFFNEPRKLRSTIWIMCIIAGAVGVKITSGH